MEKPPRAAFHWELLDLFQVVQFPESGRIYVRVFQHFLVFGKKQLRTIVRFRESLKEFVFFVTSWEYVSIDEFDTDFYQFIESWSLGFPKHRIEKGLKLGLLG
jgi:hypothetical protein